MSLRVSVLHIRLRVLKIPRPDNDQITFPNPLATAHFPRDAGHAALTVFAQHGHTATAEDLGGECEHFVDFFVGHFDTDFAVACVFRILKTCEFLDVHFFLKSATQSVSPVQPSGQPFLKSPPETGPSTAPGAHQAPTRALAADSASAMSWPAPTPKYTVVMRHRMMAMRTGVPLASGPSRPSSGSWKNITSPTRR